MSFLLAKDAISGKEGMIWATIDGKVKELAEVRNFTATFDKTKAEFHSLGQRGTQHKATGWSGTGTLDLYYVSTDFIKMLVDYAKTGKDQYFNLTVKNEDPNSSVGAQKVTLGMVNIDGGDILKLNVDADFLDTSFNFTYSEIDILEKFKPYTV